MLNVKFYFFFWFVFLIFYVGEYKIEGKFLVGNKIIVVMLLWNNCNYSLVVSFKLKVIFFFWLLNLIYVFIKICWFYSN